METAESYRAYWAALTGRNEREIYIPEALREQSGDEGEDG